MLTEQKIIGFKIVVATPKTIIFSDLWWRQDLTMSHWTNDISIVSHFLRYLYYKFSFYLFYAQRYKNMFPMRRFTTDISFQGESSRQESGESALSRSMRYADPWLYGGVPPAAGGLLLAPALVLCACPDYINGTTKGRSGGGKKSSSPTTCKKCKGTRLPLSTVSFCIYFQFCLIIYHEILFRRSNFYEYFLKLCR